MKIRFLSIILLFYSSLQFAQEKEDLDYMITIENDTIYGALQRGLWHNTFVEPKYNEYGGLELINHKIKPKEIKGFRLNDFVNVMKTAEDGIYLDAVELKPDTTAITSPDFIITASNDTVYGKIKFGLLGNSIRTSAGEKLKIKYPAVKSFRHQAMIYEYKFKEKVSRQDKKEAYMLLVFQSGTFKIYGYTCNGGPIYYFIEKDEKMEFIDYENYFELMRKYFPGNPKLTKLIEYGAFGYDNMYLIAKYYFKYGKGESVAGNSLQPAVTN
jgi:hypothetical protein